MQKRVFYHPGPCEELVHLSEEESHHCLNVLRFKAGDHIRLADGNGMEAEAVIVQAGKKNCSVRILERSHHARRQHRLHLAISPVKSADRIEWFLEKAVELGLDELSFITCEHSERSRINRERLHKIALSAMKQSKQWYLPVIHDPVPFQVFIGNASGLKLIAACGSDPGSNIAGRLKGSHEHDITVMIGPEGDFSPAELKAASDAGFLGVSLGASTLRSETAALYVCALLRPAL